MSGVNILGRGGFSGGEVILRGEYVLIVLLGAEDVLRGIDFLVGGCFLVCRLILSGGDDLSGGDFG